MSFDSRSFRDLPLLGIVRGIRREILPDLFRAVSAAGLRSIEITCNTKGVAELIAELKSLAGDRLSVGAGTVLSTADLAEILDAGADFAVSPVLVEDVAKICRDRGVAYFPGALTPSEVWKAWQAGAEMVKVFPSGFFGPTYFRELKAPLDGLSLLACGGVSATNASQYLSCGADALAFGGSIFRSDWIEEGRWDRVESAVCDLVAAVQSAKDEAARSAASSSQS